MDNQQHSVIADLIPNPLVSSKLGNLQAPSNQEETMSKVPLSLAVDN